MALLNLNSYLLKGCSINYPGYVFILYLSVLLSSFGFYLAHFASFISRYARITPSSTYKLISAKIPKSDKAN